MLIPAHICHWSPSSHMFPLWEMLTRLEVCACVCVTVCIFVVMRCYLQLAANLRSLLAKGVLTGRALPVLPSVQPQWALDSLRLWPARPPNGATQRWRCWRMLWQIGHDREQGAAPHHLPPSCYFIEKIKNKAGARALAPQMVGRGPVESLSVLAGCDSERLSLTHSPSLHLHLLQRCSWSSY